MGSDIQRALLWILFGLSAFMLYDRWEVYNGRPSFFGAETQQVATTEAPKNEAALPSQSQTASLPAEAKTRLSRFRLKQTSSSFPLIRKVPSSSVLNFEKKNRPFLGRIPALSA